MPSPLPGKACWCATWRAASTNRARSHWRGKKLKSKTPAVDAFACNEVRLLVACLAYQIMHIARRVLAKATGTGWSLRCAACASGCSGPVPAW